MSSGSFRRVNVGCPFFRFDEKASCANRIVCEGIVDDSSTILSFRHKKDFEMQFKTFCCNYYKNCEIYRMLIENKYEEDL